MGPNEFELMRMATFVEEGATEFVRESVRRTLIRLQIRTPVDTSYMKSSWSVGIGEPTLMWSNDNRPRRGADYGYPDATLVARNGLAGFALGDTPVIGNAARHANIIAEGRRMASNGKMIGSEQAPDPFIPVAIEEARRIMEGWQFTGQGPF